MDLEKLATIVKKGFASVDKKFKSVDERSDKLATIVKKGFASVDKKFKSVDERSDKLAIIMKEGFDVVDERFGTMRTYMDQRFDTLEKEVRDMRQEFAAELIQLRSDIESVKGFSKEIDILFSRVSILEDKFEKLDMVNT